MLVYKYDKTTKEYLGSKQAMLDPLESKKQGKDIFLLPANATFIEPPSEEGKAAIYVNNAWELVEDHRGLKGYLNGFEHTIKTLGAIPNGFSLDKPDENQGMSRREEILTELNTNDLNGARSARAIALALARGESVPQEDIDRLQAVENRAQKLREELASL